MTSTDEIDELMKWVFRLVNQTGCDPSSIDAEADVWLFIHRRCQLIEFCPT
jgi:hypothetical protein